MYLSILRVFNIYFKAEFGEALVMGTEKAKQTEKQADY